jgi:hypothetical protein
VRKHREDKPFAVMAAGLIRCAALRGRRRRRTCDQPEAADRAKLKLAAAEAAVAEAPAAAVAPGNRHLE